MLVALVSGVFSLFALLVGWLLASGTPTQRLLNRINLQTGILKDLPGDLDGRDVLTRALTEDLATLESIRFPTKAEDVRSSTVFGSRKFRIASIAWMLVWNGIALTALSQVSSNTWAATPLEAPRSDLLLLLAGLACTVISYAPFAIVILRLRKRRREVESLRLRRYAEFARRATSAGGGSART